MDALAQLNASLAGRYSIEREIGRGGMATVYLARDVRHARNVAVKVLNPELGAVLGVERFLSEIQVTANLQHPNLLPLFDSGQADGLLFYVMPFIEGESLRKRLMREKQLPIEEAIHIASPVAGALDYAHRHGVIHRDLKPENILLNESQPLVADFGIALAVSKAGGERITQSGVSLGTPHYMSPEQATGDRAIDGRTDIYSLGAVLYEMLTGDPPHTASTAQAIIAKVLTDTPQDVRVMRPHVPAHVAAAVACALEKLPADRFHTAGEFAQALEGRGAAVAIPSGVRTPGAVEPLLTRSRWHRFVRRRVLTSLSVAFVAGSAVGGFAAWRSAARTTNESVTFSIDPPAPNDIRERIGPIDITPDGRAIAFIALSDSSSQVYVRGLDDLEARPVPGTNGAAEIAFSLDGTWLAVITFGGKLFKVLLDGSSAVTLADGATYWGRVTWENERSILIGMAPGAEPGIARIAANGGTPRVLTKVRSAGWEHGRPFVADENTLLFADWGPGFTEDDYLAIGSLKTGDFTTTSLPAVHPMGVVDNRIVYLNPSGAIMAVPFDRRSRRITAEPVRVMEGVTITGEPEAALSANGTLVYKRRQPTQLLVLVDSSGVARPLTTEARDFGSWFGSGRLRFSPDGRRIAVQVFAVRTDSITVDIWTFDIGSRTFSRLTAIGNVTNPEWTPDGKYLVFATKESRSPAIWRQIADGSKPAERLLQLPDGHAVFAPHPTPDGRGVVYCQWVVGASVSVFYLPFTGDKKPSPVHAESISPFDCWPRVSPDGRWLAYVENDGAISNVFVRSFKGTGRRVQVSADGGDSPLWSPDGSRLYYRRTKSGFGSGSLFVAHVKSTSDDLDIVGRERVVALRESGMYDIAPDGKHVLMLHPSDSAVQLVVKTNWVSQLRARLAGTR